MEYRRRNIRWMIAIIALCLLGIVLRWEFIRGEVAAVLGNMFPR